MWATFRCVEREFMTSSLASPLEALLLVLSFVGVILAGCLACWWIVAEVTTRWRRPDRSGLCETCGYNLYGLPQPRCPERGTDFRPDLTNANPRA